MLGLDGLVWSASRFSPCPAPDRPWNTSWIGGCKGHGEENNPVPTGNQTPVIQPTSSHYTNQTPVTIPWTSHYTNQIPITKPKTSHHTTKTPVIKPTACHNTHQTPVIKPTATHYTNQAPVIKPTASHYTKPSRLFLFFALITNTDHFSISVCPGLSLLRWTVVQTLQ